ncbi:hypothetical protein ACFXCZ_31370 [Streptomyces sp. NPDC059396]|uniref:hypothetical protein n=1 Tax=Streptomyces sp. NPDC059396 TaxID=3346819 RepID=UPI0036BFD7A8
MTSVSGAPGSIEATTALLLGELPELEAQQRTLQTELATVTERLDSVRAALSALQALSLAPRVVESGASEAAEAVAPAEGDVPAGESAEPSAEAPAGEADSEAGTDAAGTEADEAPVRPRIPRARAGRKAAEDAASEDAPKERKRRTAKKAVADAGTEDQPAGGLTEQILTVLADAGDTPVRARDVAQVLGRDDSPGSINAVRSTLDRLVGSSRAHRAGRGLYQAVQD